MTDIAFSNNADRKSRLLFDYLDQAAKNTGKYSALILNLYKLQDTSILISIQQKVTEVFVPVAANAKTFHLNNNIAVIVFDIRSKDEILSCMVKLKFLLQKDPSLKNNDDLEASGIAKFYDISTQIDEIKNDATISTQAIKDNNKQINSAAGGFQNLYNNLRRSTKKELTPETLAKVQKTLSVADFSSFIRRQSVCAIIGKSSPQRVFDEVYVSIPDLREMLLPDIELTLSPWLFLSLSETLDRRVLQTISRHDDGSLLGNFSININVSTILSDDFMRFDDNINASMRSTIVLELQLMDIFSDINAYMLAKNFAQARGYKICIDGITVDKLNYLNRQSLQCDLMKIIWHPSFYDVMCQDPHFMDYTNKAERAKMILCRIDDPKAVEVGNSIGINLYQGRYIQRLLNQRAGIQK
ncbi:MAG: hypothetical protein E7012_06200 [Alphaproteobacteria bacterium]|nr:hypothetical protein [Alphaproteobacteria bacterium]